MAERTGCGPQGGKITFGGESWSPWWKRRGGHGRGVRQTSQPWEDFVLLNLTKPVNDSEQEEDLI